MGELFQLAFLSPQISQEGCSEAVTFQGGKAAVSSIRTQRSTSENAPVEGSLPLSENNDRLYKLCKLSSL